jgi:hypothetical protein
MRKFGGWIGAALIAQPYYSDEIRLGQMLLQTWVHRLQARAGDR